MPLQPKQLAIEYYFGDLQYWKFPKIAVDALEEGYDGPALRMLAWITDPVLAEMDLKPIDVAFREMGVVDAPLPKERARLLLAAQLAQHVQNDAWDVYEAAAHLRIHLCELKDPPDELREIWSLATEARNAPRSRWRSLKQELHQAFSVFLERHKPD